MSSGIVAAEQPRKVACRYTEELSNLFGSQHAGAPRFKRQASLAIGPRFNFPGLVLVAELLRERSRRRFSKPGTLSG
jgi:hypothetical protein